MGAIAVVVFVSGGCGKEDSSSASSFCDASREWAVHELTPPHETNPASIKAHFTDYSAFVDKSLASAPEEVADDWQVYADVYKTRFLPVMEKFHYSFEEADANGTDQEKEFFNGARPPEAEAAFKEILAYEGQVCGSQGPQAADISFAGEKPGAYCEIAGKMNQLIGEVVYGGASPKVLRKVVTGDERRRLSEQLIDEAPLAIRDDVRKLEEFDRSKQRNVLDKYDYDVKKLILSGSAEDRATFQHQDRSVREPRARVAAYEEQVCGA